MTELTWHEICASTFDSEANHFEQVADAWERSGRDDVAGHIRFAASDLRAAAAALRSTAAAVTRTGDGRAT